MSGDGANVPLPDPLGSDLQFTAHQRRRLRPPQHGAHKRRRRKVPHGQLPSLPLTRLSKSAGALPSGTSEPPPAPPNNLRQLAPPQKSPAAAWHDTHAAAAGVTPVVAPPAALGRRQRRGGGDGGGGGRRIYGRGGGIQRPVYSNNAAPGFGFGSTSHTRGDFISNALCMSASPGPMYDTSADTAVPKPLGFFTTEPRPLDPVEDAVPLDPAGKAAALMNSRRQRWGLEGMEKGTSAVLRMGDNGADDGVSAGVYMIEAMAGRATGDDERSLRPTGHVWFGSSWDLEAARSRVLRQLAVGGGGDVAGDGGEMGTGSAEHPHGALVRAVRESGLSGVRFRVLRRIRLGGGPAGRPIRFDSSELKASLAAALHRERTRITRARIHILVRCIRRVLFLGGGGDPVCNCGAKGDEVLPALGPGAWTVWRQLVTRQQEQELLAAVLQVQAVARGAHGRQRARRWRRLCAAVFVQRAARGMLGRAEARLERYQIASLAAALMLQRVWRGELGRRRAVRRAVRRRRCRAAVRLQRLFRGGVGRAIFAAAWHARAQINAATCIQAVQRGIMHREMCAQLRRAPFEYSAAVAIQRWARGNAGRERHARITCETRWALKSSAAATCIQRRLARGPHGRRCARARRVELHGERMAKRIQRRWRRFVHECADRRAYRKQREEAAARLLQRVWRGRRGRLAYAKLCRQRDELHAACTLQRAWRRHVVLRREAAIRQRIREAEAATLLQARYRAFVARRIYLADQKRRIAQAAIRRLQKLWRGIMGRRRTAELRWLKRCHAAATTLQCAVRKRFAYKRVSNRRVLRARGLCRQCDERLAVCFSARFALPLCDTCYYHLENVEAAQPGAPPVPPRVPGLPVWENVLPSEDRVVPIERHRQETRAAITIQATYRAHAARWTVVHGICEEAFCSKPAQLYCPTMRKADVSHESMHLPVPRSRPKPARKPRRGKLGMRLCFGCARSAARVPHTQHKFVPIRIWEQQCAAAVAVEAVIRGMLVRAKLARERMERQMLAALLIQRAVVRGPIGRKRALERKRFLIELAALKERMATKVQSIVRMNLGQRRVQERRDALEAIEEAKRAAKRQAVLEQQSALVLQMSWRCVLARRRRGVMWRHKREKLWYLAVTRPRSAALIIQSAYRCRVARDRTAEARSRRDIANAAMRRAAAEEASALVLGRFWRCASARMERARRAERTNLLRQHKMRSAAAVPIQALARQYFAKIRVAARRVEYQSELDALSEAEKNARERVLAEERMALAVQSMARQHAAMRSTSRGLAAKHAAESEKQRRHAAACRIQTGVRERQRRLRLRAERAAKKAWVECWDDDAQAYYYANETTGETTWERPAVLGIASEPQMSAAALVTGVKQEGWTAYTDPETNAQYWANHETGEVVWAEEEYAAEQNVGEQWEEPAQAQDSWEEHWDEEAGAAYYYNRSTEEAVWERPAGFVQSSSSVMAQSQDEGGMQENLQQSSTWEEHWDAEAGAAYYYNRSTEEAVWECPPDFQPQQNASQQEDISQRQIASQQHHGAEDYGAYAEYEQQYSYEEYDQDQQQQYAEYEQQQQQYQYTEAGDLEYN